MISQPRVHPSHQPLSPALTHHTVSISASHNQSPSRVCSWGGSWHFLPCDIGQKVPPLQLTSWGVAWNTHCLARNPWLQLPHSRWQPRSLGPLPPSLSGIWHWRRKDRRDQRDQPSEQTWELVSKRKTKDAARMWEPGRAVRGEQEEWPAEWLSSSFPGLRGTRIPALILSPCRVFFIFWACWVFLEARELLKFWHASSVGVCGLSCPSVYEILVLQTGIEPTSPALEDGFLTTGPPGKSLPVVSLWQPPVWMRSVLCTEKSLMSPSRHL